MCLWQKATKSGWMPFQCRIPGSVGSKSPVLTETKLVAVTGGILSPVPSGAVRSSSPNHPFQILNRYFNGVRRATKANNNEPRTPPTTQITKWIGASVTPNARWATMRSGTEVKG